MLANDTPHAAQRPVPGPAKDTLTLAFMETYDVEFVAATPAGGSPQPQPRPYGRQNDDGLPVPIAPTASQARGSSWRGPGLRSGAVFLATFAIVSGGLHLLGRVTGRNSVTGDPGAVVHVHGLGRNPADGALYVATHHGTLRVHPDGKAERAGNSNQDTKGFTVAGTDRFLGSGHPDDEAFRSGQLRGLGLIESTDGGATWRSLSLSGAADFHSLAFAHGHVYGWDASSGRFMVSADTRTWDRRAALRLTAFAVDPRDPGHIVGAGPDKLVESRDGGRRWVQKQGPALRILSWDVSAGLVGATETGVVHRSIDGGTTWASVGDLPGSPQAILVTPDAWFAAAADPAGTTVIYRSGDAGRSWDTFYTGS